MVLGVVVAPAALAVSVASVDDSIVTEGDSGSTAAVFTVTLSESNGTTTVNYETFPITALAGSDYTHTTGTLTFGPSETTKSVSVSVHGDLADEANETFGLGLTSIDNGTFQGGDPQGTGTILDDDDPPSLSIADAGVTEGNSGTRSVTLDVTLDAPSGRNIAVDFATADGSATFAGGDYHSASGRLVFQTGDTVENITVTVVGDTRVEPDETVGVNLSNPVNATLADAQGVVTIHNDDSTTPPPGAPQISINDAQVTEGNSGTVQTTLTVSLSAASEEFVTVDFTTSPGAATFASGDYHQTSGRLVFAPGETSKTVAITVVGDTIVEADETFFVDLSAPTSATIADIRGTVTILNDDSSTTPEPPPPSGALPQLSITDARVPEGDGDETRTSLVVSLSEASTSSVSVNFTTMDGTARFVDGDHWTTTGRLVFAPGQTSQSVTVTVVGDTLVEPDEVFYVDLSDASNATLSKSRATVTIVNDDSTTAPPPGDGIPSISISDVSVVEGDEGTTVATAVLSLSEASTSPARVALNTVDGTATFDGADYWRTSGTLVFQAGQTSRSLELTVNGDTIPEGDERYFVDLSAPENATISKARSVITIVDDEAPASTTTTLRVRKRTRLIARGHVIPPEPDERMRVVLRKKRNGRFRTIARRRPVLGAALDRNGDGVFESAYRTSFRRPNRGRCLIKAVFPGGAGSERSVARVRFRC